MKAVLGAIFSRGFFVFLGLVALALVIWFWGDQLILGEHRILASERARLVLIAVIFVIWLVRLLYRRYRSEARGSALYQALLSIVNDPNRHGNVLANTEMGAKFRDALEAIRRQRGARFFESVPIHVLIGPPGVGKTKALQHSGLLSPIRGDDRARGRGFELSDPFGTKDCDWFVSRDGLLLDTAGRLMSQSVNPDQDADDWSRLLTLLRGARRHPINGVVAAFAVSDLLAQSAEQRREEATRARERIDELQATLKATLPVYVLITKADTIPGFVEFFEDLDDEGLKQVWGVTFAYDAAAARPSDSGVAELPARLRDLAARVERRLASRLYVEAHPGYRARMMQFSREIWELEGVLDDLVGDLFGAHSRGVRDPIFRGLYLTSGMQDGTYVGGYLQSLARSVGVGVDEGPAVDAAAAGEGKSFFVHDLFSKVVFPEAKLVSVDPRHAALTVWTRRAAYAGVGAAAIGALAALATSHTANKGYLDDVAESLTAADAEGVAAADGPLAVETQIPPLDAMWRAVRVAERRADAPDDAYRDFCENPDDARDGLSRAAEPVPVHMGLGLYLGDTVTSLLRRAYRSELADRLLPFMAQRLGLGLAAARGNPDLTYPYLKAYLMVGERDQRDVDRCLVQGVLTYLWLDDHGGDPGVPGQLMRHFSALADPGLAGLPLEPELIDTRLVETVREELRDVAFERRILGQLMQLAITERVSPFVLTDYLRRNGVGDVSDAFQLDPDGHLGHVVPPLFTYEGFKIFQERKGALVEDVAADAWVLADKPTRWLEESLGELATRLDALYESEFVDHWRTLLESIRVRRFADARSGKPVLSALIAERPVPSILRAVTYHTDLDRDLQSDETSDDLVSKMRKGARRIGSKVGLGGAASRAVGAAAQSRLQDRIERRIAQADPFPKLHALAAPEDTRLGDVEGAFRELLTHLESATDIEQPDKTRTAAVTVGSLAYPVPIETWLRNLARDTDAAAGALMDVRKKNEEAEARAEARTALAAEWNEDLLPVCESLVSQYPFSRTATAGAGLKDFEAFFRPGGLVDGFFERHLAPHVDRSRPGQWAWKASAPIGDQAMLDRFRHAQAITRAFFDGNGHLGVTFSMKPVELSKRLREFHLFINGTVLKDRHAMPRATAVSWPGEAGAGSVRAVFVSRAEDRATREDKQDPSGPWAWFRYLDRLREAGRVSENAAGNLELRFEVEEGMHSLWELRFESELRPFDLPALSAFRCGGAL